MPEALKQLRTLPHENLGASPRLITIERFVRDSRRSFLRGKTVAQVVAIAKTLLRKNKALLATRVEPSVAKAPGAPSKRATYHDDARVVAIAPPKLVRRGSVLIVTAGTADIPVAEEARDGRYHGQQDRHLVRCGSRRVTSVARSAGTVARCAVLVVAAGMDGVLPSVVGGLVRQPVIAVPTSRGYGRISAAWPRC